MKLCDSRHPEHFVYGSGYQRSWGGYVGDMPTKSICPFFNQVIIYRTMTRTVAEFPGKRFVEIRDKNSKRCCAHHEREAEILKVAQYKEAIQTQQLTVLDKNKLNDDPFARAFLLARRIQKNVK